MSKEEMKEILKYLEGNLSEDEEIEAIRGLGDTGEKEAWTHLIGMLKKNYDSSWRIKNAIALALGDLGYDESVPYLMDVVKNPAYKGYSGTFLWALTIKPMQCKEYFLDFIRLLCTGSLEIQESAVILIEKFYNEVSPETIKQSLEILLSNRILLESHNSSSEIENSTIKFIEHIEEMLLDK